MIYQLITDVICAALNALGGYHWLYMRRFIMPAVIGVSMAITTHLWWVALLPLPAMGTLCMGYPKLGDFGRALWLFIQAVAIGLGVMLFGHLAWYFFFPYIIAAGLLGFIYSSWQQIIGDSIAGFWLGIVVLFVR